MVSTHSRPKAAGNRFSNRLFLVDCFNTQPPEGGWDTHRLPTGFHRCFNTQPPEGGWVLCRLKRLNKVLFQHTAARRRLDQPVHFHCLLRSVSTHSRPKAAGKVVKLANMRNDVSTHSRPKAAGYEIVKSSEYL